MSTSATPPIKGKVRKNKLKKRNLKKCTSFKEPNTPNILTPIVTEYSVKLTHETDIVIRKNAKCPSGVELRLKRKIKGIDFDEWKRVCNSVEVISTVKDLLNGTMGKEEEPSKNELSFTDVQNGVDDVDSLYNALNSLNEEAMTMTTE